MEMDGVDQEMEKNKLTKNILCKFISFGANNEWS